MKSVNDTAILKEKKNLSVSSKTRTFDLPISISDALSLLLMSFVAFDGFFLFISSRDICQEKDNY